MRVLTTSIGCVIKMLDKPATAPATKLRNGCFDPEQVSDPHINLNAMECTGKRIAWFSTFLAIVGAHPLKGRFDKENPGLEGLNGGGGDGVFMPENPGRGLKGEAGDAGGGVCRVCIIWVFMLSIGIPVATATKQPEMRPAMKTSVMLTQPLQLHTAV